MPQSCLSKTPIEGDYIETLDGLMFVVKGMFHPPGRIIAYLRYVPDPHGERKRGDVSYRRMYDLDETSNLLNEQYPQYLVFVPELGLKLQSVLVENIAKIYKPSERLRELTLDPKTDLEKKIVNFSSILSSESGVSPEFMGVSGSVLISLESLNSDVDLVVYGTEASTIVYDALWRLRDKVDGIKSYNEGTIVNVLKSRWEDTGIDLNRLKPIEIRKKLHGIVGDRDYFIRLVKLRGEAEREISSSPIAKVRLRGVIINDRDSIFTPCVYEINNSKILGSNKQYPVTELVSFRGKFTEQSNNGEEIEARGTLEKAAYRGRTVFRVILGEKGDYLVPTLLLD